MTRLNNVPSNSGPTSSFQPGGGSGSSNSPAGLNNFTFGRKDLSTDTLEARRNAAQQFHKDVMDYQDRFDKGNQSTKPSGLDGSQQGKSGESFRDSLSKWSEQLKQGLSPQGQQNSQQSTAYPKNLDITI